MPVYTFDTPVIIAYKIKDLPPNLLLSAVVLAELTAGSPDDSIRKLYAPLRALSPLPRYVTNRRK
jgi:hypothetical protein